MNYELRIKKFKRAFTLVEVVVAIGVLLVGVLGVASFFAYSTKIARSASNTSVASNLAQGVLDYELSQSYDELTPGTGSVMNSSLDRFQQQVNISLLELNPTTKDLEPSATDKGLKKIDVYIFYKEGNNTKNVQMSTIKAKK